MVKKRTTIPHEQLCDPVAPRHGADSGGDAFASIHQPLKRYTCLALTLSITCGGLLIFAGHHPLGKGLILGALFSIINFIIMAAVLPLRIGRGRGPSTLISLASIAVRYAVLAIPLVIAARHSQFAIATTAVGLFMVQLIIVADQARSGRRLFVAAEE